MNKQEITQYIDDLFAWCDTCKHCIFGERWTNYNRCENGVKLYKYKQFNKEMGHCKNYERYHE